MCLDILQGNKSFVAFSNLADADSLTKTWKVCTKVASYLEQGQRLENLSWRLWHLQNLMVDTDNAKSKREFKKLSKHMGDKLDKEKGRSIEELQAPGFRRNQSTDMIQLRAAEKERNRLASLHATPGTIKRMQFTFSVEQPSGSSEAQPLTVAKPDLKPSSEFKDGSHKRSRPNNAVVPSSSSSARQATTSSSSSHTTPTPNHSSSSMSMDVDGMDQPLTQRGMKPLPSASQPAGDGSYSSEWSESGLRFPSLFSNDFGPTALLNPSPSVRGSLSYGEDVVATLSSSADAFGVVRPTLELPLDDILSTLTDSPEPYTFTNGKMDAEMFGPDGILPYDLGGQEMYGAVDAGVSTEHVLGPVPQHQQRQQQTMSPPPVPSKEPKTVSPSKLGTAPPNSLGEQPRPRLTLKTSSGAGSRGAGNAGLGATASAASSTNGTGQSSSSSNGKSGTSSAPGGVKAECSNCGATHTPLWRRGLNDELNCNACGLYCKLHKRPRPKSMRNNHNSSSSNNPSSSAASSSSASQTDSRAHGSSASARAAAQAAQAAQPDATQESMGAGSMGHVGRARSGSASLVGTGSAQCYNCHTTTTPLWRKDDEGKTVCNACGLYYKLHGSARPISMKSDVIRKRSRHDAARRSIAETPSASPGASRRNSPVGDNGVATVSTPTFAPDSTTQVFDYDFQPAQSELMGALGDAGLSGQSFGSAVAAAAGLAAFGAFPGPYHPDYLMKNYGDMMSVYATGGASSATTNHGQDEDGERANKRRRMSNVSTTSSSTDPPLSAASSYSSYESAGYASSAPTSVSSSRSSGGGLPGSGNSNASGSNGNGSSSAGAVDFPYAQYNSYGLMRAAGPSAFWHPPMLPQTHSPSASFVHPPMLPPSDDSDYGYGQQQQQQAQQQQQQQQQQAQQNREDVDGLFSTYLHPPMILPESPELGGGLTSLHGLKGVHPPMLPPDYADMQTGY